MNYLLLEMASAGCFDGVASFDQFIAAMFGDDIDEVPARTQNEFYEDYVSSGLPLAAYVGEAIEEAV